VPLLVVPILQCLDLQRSVTFYGRLGFEAHQMSGYAVFVAGGAELHLSRTVRAVPGGCLIHVGDVSALRNELNDRGIEPLGPVEEEGEPGTGLRSLTVIDPDGNHLRFVSPWSGPSKVE
jgi:catechol 2,3-dioxygenase-like lactoylglutathione lyase family enzyme